MVIMSQQASICFSASGGCSATLAVPFTTCALAMLIHRRLAMLIHRHT